MADYGHVEFLKMLISIYVLDEDILHQIQYTNGTWPQGGAHIGLTKNATGI